MTQQRAEPEPLNGLQRAALNLRFDRVAECREQADWLHAGECSGSARFVLLDQQRNVLVEFSADKLQWLTAQQRSAWLAHVPAHFLGAEAATMWFMLVLGEADVSRIETQLRTRTMGLRQVGLLLDPFSAGLAVYAVALMNWHTSARFCGRCGASMKIVAAGHRAECTGCKQLQFPRTDAAIIVIVEHEGACLLGRQATWPAKRYSALAGFVEPGETLEHAVCREVHEEAGIEVIDVAYHSSQPWPFPASLMIGFTATARNRNITLLDGELEDARWFERDELIKAIRTGELGVSSRLSISWHLLEDWLIRAGGQSLDTLAADCG